jgi:heavy metal sensor kinase
VKRSIRLRLVAWILALLLPASLGAAWLLVEVFGNRLLHEIDVALEEEAETVAALLAKPETTEATARMLNHIASETDLGAGEYVVITRAGRVIEEAPPGAHVTLTGKDPALRVARHVTGPPGNPTVVWVAVRATAALRARQRLTALLAIGMPIGLLLVVAGLWFVVGHALAPLEETSRRLEAIDLGNLSTRLPVANPDDEVGRMVTVLNGMLARLEAAVSELHRFTADAAHELRTPLAVLRTGLDVALSRPRSAEEYREALGEALASSDRLCRLAEDLLTLARLERLERPEAAAAVDIGEVLQELADAWAQVAGRQEVRLQVSAPGRPTVRGNAGDLYRLFNNLIENGLRHAPRGSAVALRAEAKPDCVEVEVRDFGPGIAADQVERVFDRFHRGDGARTERPGTGLGLSIAQEIARTHGGRVTLANAEPGCAARVTLPRAADG